MRKLQTQYRIGYTTGLIVLVFSIIVVGCAGIGTRTDTHQAQILDQIEDQWGVRPVALRLTAAGHFIDFRLKVIDPEKAKAVLDRTHKAYLVDEDSGKVLPVPMTKLGPLRGSDVMPKKDRHYVILFQNSTRVLQPGSKVTVVIGDFQAKGLTVS